MHCNRWLRRAPDVAMVWRDGHALHSLARWPPESAQVSAFAPNPDTGPANGGDPSRARRAAPNRRASRSISWDRFPIRPIGPIRPICRGRPRTQQRAHVHCNPTRMTAQLSTTRRRMARRIERCTSPDNCAIVRDRSTRRDGHALHALARWPPESAQVSALPAQRYFLFRVQSQSGGY